MATTVMNRTTITVLRSRVFPLATRSSRCRSTVRQGLVPLPSLPAAASRTARKGLLGCPRHHHAAAAAWSRNDPHGEAAAEDQNRRLPDGMINQFDLLGLPTVFDIDEQQLKANYLKIMVESHPDKLASKRSGQNSIEAATAACSDDSDGRLASLATKAFDVLQRPHTRAQHLLELAGHPLEEAATAEMVGLDFLAEILEWREDIQATSDPRMLHEWRDMCRDRTRETCQKLSAALDAHDWAGALEQTAQLQYWNRVDETLRDKMDTLE